MRVHDNIPRRERHRAMPEESMPRNADETRTQLMRAAERLFAERGIEVVSLREINRAAAQRNATALQYHFGGCAKPRVRNAATHWINIDVGIVDSLANARLIFP